jgi:endonuclease/exonuclease/phosphatase family metal-dependent hydrolase
MKLLNINIGIKIDNSEKIGKFLKEYSCDIVNLQEIVRNLEGSVLPKFKSKEVVEKIVGNTYPFNFFGPLWTTDSFRVNDKVVEDFGGFIEQGNETFSKYPIIRSRNIHFYKTYEYARDWTNWESEDHGRAVVVSEIAVGNESVQILNLHGIWTKDKQGDQRTIDECKFLVDLSLQKNMPTIITGDFNLYPDTKSISILNENFRNLTDVYDIKTTRPLSKSNGHVNRNVVDYIFVNELVKVVNFEVIQTDITDHLPLLLEFEI